MDIFAMHLFALQDHNGLTGHSSDSLFIKEMVEAGIIAFYV
jgi:hypothetical protein